MQNKPNLLDAQMNVSSILTKDYENETTFRLEQNKPKQSRWIKKVRSIFRPFILASLTQTTHINLTTPIFDPKTRTPPKMSKKP